MFMFSAVFGLLFNNVVAQGVVAEGVVVGYPTGCQGAACAVCQADAPSFYACPWQNVKDCPDADEWAWEEDSFSGCGALCRQR